VNVVFNIRRAARRKLLKTLQPCGDFVPLMSESLDRRLTMRESIYLKLHLWVCSWCVRYLSQIRMIRDLFCLRDEDSEFGSETLSLDARERIRRSLKNDR
jgi:hypothetical protein